MTLLLLGRSQSRMTGAGRWLCQRQDLWRGLETVLQRTRLNQLKAVQVPSHDWRVPGGYQVGTGEPVPPPVTASGASFVDTGPAWYATDVPHQHKNDRGPVLEYSQHVAGQMRGIWRRRKYSIYVRCLLVTVDVDVTNEVVPRRPACIKKQKCYNCGTWRYFMWVVQCGLVPLSEGTQGCTFRDTRLYHQVTKAVSFIIQVQWNVCGDRMVLHGPCQWIITWSHLGLCFHYISKVMRCIQLSLENVTPSYMHTLYVFFKDSCILCLDCPVVCVCVFRGMEEVHH